MFQLHPRLAEDTYYVGDFPLCALLLSRDANYPWFILVPRVAGVTEIHQLEPASEKRTDVAADLDEALERRRGDAADDHQAIGGSEVPQHHMIADVEHHLFVIDDEVTRRAGWPLRTRARAIGRECRSGAQATHENGGTETVEASSKLTGSVQGWHRRAQWP